MGAVRHHFSEYAGNSGFLANMLDRNSTTICNLFASCILGMFKVEISFGGHIVTPFDTHIIVIVENSGVGSVADRIPQGGEMGYHIAAVDRQT